MQSNSRRWLSAIREVLRYAIPISSSGILNMIAGFIGLMFVAKLGKIDLAASALATSTFYALVTFGTTTAYAISILIGRYHQQDQPLNIGKVVRYGLIVCVLVGVVVGICLWNVGHVLLWFGQNPKLVALTIGYFHYAAFVILFFMFSMVVLQLHVGIGKPIFGLYATLTRLPATVILSYGFILGKWGLPQMGLAGMTFSLLLVQIVYCSVLVGILLWNKKLKPYRIFGPIVRSELRDYGKRILQLGIPIGLQFSGEITAMALGTYMIGYFGVEALAASQIVGQFSLIPVMITLGVAQAVAVLISQHQTQPGCVKLYVIAAYIPMFCLYLIVGYCFITESNFLCHLFLEQKHTINGELLNLARYFFLLAALFILIDGLRNILSGALRGLHDSKTPMFVGLGSIWLLSLPAAYLLGYRYFNNPIALRACFISGFLFAVIVMLIILQRRQQTASP